MFQSDNSDTNREVDQWSETRSKRTVGNQSPLLACPHPGEGMDQSNALTFTYLARTPGGEREGDNIKVYLHVINIWEGKGKERGK